MAVAPSDDALSALLGYFDWSPEATMALDPETLQLLTVNPAFRDSIAPLPCPIGQSFVKAMVHPEDQDDLLAVLAAAADTAIPMTTRCRLLGPSGGGPCMPFHWRVKRHQGVMVLSGRPEPSLLDSSGLGQVQCQPNSLSSSHEAVTLKDLGLLGSGASAQCSPQPLLKVNTAGVGPHPSTTTTSPNFSMSITKPLPIPKPSPWRCLRPWAPAPRKPRRGEWMDVCRALPGKHCPMPRVLPVDTNPLATNVRARVLVVDDNVLCQRSVCQCLELLGYGYGLAGDGHSACLLVQANPGLYDLVLMDLRMPVMDGLVATQYLREQLRVTMPIVMFSAETGQEIWEQARKAGATGMLGKPFTSESLAQMLANTKLDHNVK